MRGPLILGAILFLAVPARAATIVVNGADGRDCYIATALAPSPGNDRRALAACDDAVRASAGGSFARVAALVNRADIRLQMLDYQGAAADSQDALAISRDEPSAYINRGAALVGLGRYDEAIGDLDKAIALGGSPLQAAYYNRALAQDYLGEFPGAYRDYKNALTVDPKFTPAAEQLARFRVAH